MPDHPYPLQRWTHPTRHGFTMRGWHSVPSGKPLLHVLHGNGFCAQMYEPMLAPLQPHFDLWLCDVQGHGDSDEGPRFLGWNRNAELAFEALQAQGKAFKGVPHHAIGHSFGGVLTALMLAQHPKAFERAVLLDPAIMPPGMLFGLTLAQLTRTAHLAPMARQAKRRRPHWPSRDAAFASLHDRGVYKGWTDEALKAYVQHALKDCPDGRVALKCPPEREAEIFSTGPHRLWSQLTRVQSPTLLLKASHTIPFIREGCNRFAHLNPHVVMKKVPGGHCFMQENPAGTAQTVANFLTKD